MSRGNVPSLYFRKPSAPFRGSGKVADPQRKRGETRQQRANLRSLVDYFAVKRVSTEKRMTPKPTLIAELIAEFLGTFVLILFGTGVVAMVVLFPTKNPGETIHGGFTNITLGWGLAVTMGIYIAGKDFRSPSESRGDVGARGVPQISLAQGAALLASPRRPAHSPPPRWCIWNYQPAFHQVDPQLDHTAGVFTTFPAFPGDAAGGISRSSDRHRIAACLLIFAITDEFNMPPGANLAPLLIGLVVVAIGMSFGGMHGYAINPARDFGPRLFTVVAGFRNNGLTDGITRLVDSRRRPLLGGLAGAALYDFGIRRFLRP